MRNNLDNELLQLIGKFHDLLGIAWPKPGVPEMIGASTFIGTNLFKALKDGLGQIEHRISYFQNPARSELFLFWDTFSNFFSKLEQQNRNEKSVCVDEAVNLLYFASGVLYHRIIELTSATLETDPRLIGIENMSKLLEVCKWTGAKCPLKQIANEVVVKMNQMTMSFDGKIL